MAASFVTMRVPSSWRRPLPPSTPQARARWRWVGSWAALALPGVVRLSAALLAGEVLDAGRVFSWCGPGALLGAWALWALRAGSARARLQKELRPLSPVAAVWAGVGLMAACSPRFIPAGVVQLVASVVLPALGVLAFAEDGTLEQWLVQPLPRWRLLAEKGFPLALVALGFLWQLRAFGEGHEWGAGHGPLLAVTLGVAPALALSLRDSVNALVVSVLVALGGLAAFSPAFESSMPSLASPVVTVVLLAGSWVALLRPPAELGAPDFLRRRLWAAAGRTALGSLVRKEARLQLPVLVVPVAFCTTLLLAARLEAVLAPVLLFFAAMGALLAGTVAVASEHEYGTAEGQLVLVPSRLAWRVKVLSSLGAAVVVGLLLGGLYLLLRPGPLVMAREALWMGGSWADPEGEALKSQLTFAIGWTFVSVVAWVAGLLASTLSRRMTTSFLTALGLLGGSLAVLGGLLAPGRWLGEWLLEPVILLGHGPPHLAAPSPWSLVVRVLGVVLLLVLPAAAFLRCASGARDTGRVTARGWFGVAAAVALAGLAAGVAVC